jgi:hypothetical protein
MKASFITFIILLLVTLVSIGCISLKTKHRTMLHVDHTGQIFKLGDNPKALEYTLPINTEAFISEIPVMNVNIMSVESQLISLYIDHINIVENNKANAIVYSNQTAVSHTNNAIVYSNQTVVSHANNTIDITSTEAQSIVNNSLIDNILTVQIPSNNTLNIEDSAIIEQINSLMKTNLSYAKQEENVVSLVIETMNATNKINIGLNIDVNKAPTVSNNLLIDNLADVHVFSNSTLFITNSDSPEQINSLMKTNSNYAEPEENIVPLVFEDRAVNQNFGSDSIVTETINATIGISGILRAETNKFPTTENNSLKDNTVAVRVSTNNTLVATNNVSPEQINSSLESNESLVQRDDISALIFRMLTPTSTEISMVNYGVTNVIVGINDALNVNILDASNKVSNKLNYGITNATTTLAGGLDVNISETTNLDNILIFFKGNVAEETYNNKLSSVTQQPITMNNTQLYVNIFNSLTMENSSLTDSTSIVSADSLLIMLDKHHRMSMQDIIYTGLKNGLTREEMGVTLPFPFYDSPSMQSAWTNALLYKNFTNTPIVSLVTNLRVYCEAVIPKNDVERITQEAAIQRAVSNGYNVIMLSYYCEGTPEEIVAVTKIIKKYGAKVMFTVGGREWPETPWTRAINMDDVIKVITATIAEFDYFLPMWRGLTPHHRKYYEATFYEDLEKVLIQIALKNKPNIPILGTIESGDSSLINGCSAVFYMNPIRTLMETRIKYACDIPVIYGPVCSPNMYAYPQDEVRASKIASSINGSYFKFHGNGILSNDMLTRTNWVMR